jgi:hypothetical protein
MLWLKNLEVFHEIEKTILTHIRKANFTKSFFIFFNEKPKNYEKNWYQYSQILSSSMYHSYFLERKVIRLNGIRDKQMANDSAHPGKLKPTK